MIDSEQESEKKGNKIKIAAYKRMCVEIGENLDSDDDDLAILPDEYDFDDIEVLLASIYDDLMVGSYPADASHAVMSAFWYWVEGQYSVPSDFGGIKSVSPYCKAAFLLNIAFNAGVHYGLELSDHDD